MDNHNTPVITIDGAYFFKGEERFIVRGLVYQPSSFVYQPKSVRTQFSTRKPHDDHLDDANYEDLVRDIQAFRELGINALWIYRVTPGVSRTRCMNLLAENGIYVIFVLSSPHLSVNRHDPEAAYKKEALIQRFCHVIDSVAPYSNTLGVSVADSIVNQINVEKLDNLGECLSVMSKLVGDVKRYMRYREHDTGQRILPVCISDAQWSSLNTSTFNYLADAEAEGRAINGRIDFYCFVHFGQSVERHFLTRIPRDMDREGIPPPNTLPPPADTHDRLRWREMLPMQKFADLQDPIPILVSEYGNNYERPRPFNEIAELYGKNMSSPLLNILSGGFAYEFFEASNQYGLVLQEADGNRKKLLDFYNFRNAMYDAIGATEPDVQRSMMSASNRPIHLVLDFDGTLTKKDTLRLVAEVGYRRQTMLSRNPAPTRWHDIVKAYQADYAKHEIEYGRAGYIQTTASDEFAWLDSLSQVETASADRVYAAGIFDDVGKQDMELAAANAVISREVELRPGWADLFAEIEKANKYTSPVAREKSLVQLLSVNWSRWFIWNVLTKSLLALDKSRIRIGAEVTLDKMAVYANEVPSVAAQYGLTSSASTIPGGDQLVLRTAGDKLRQMQMTMSSFSELESRPLTVYVGDSVTDIQCMLMADVGIGIAAPKLDNSLHVTCERLGVEVKSLSDYKQSGRSPISTVQDLEEAIAAKQVTLYRAQDFHEIADWIARVTSDHGLSADGTPVES